MPREARARPGKPRSARRPPTKGAAASAGAERPIARGIWSGSITFGLVTVPVELYSAHRPGGASLRMLAPDGTPLARVYVSAEGKILADDAIVRGYEIEEGRFVVVTDEELEKLAPRRSRDIELLRFVDRDAIDPSYFVRAYFVLPGGEQTKAYRLLAETMESMHRAAIATFVMHGQAQAVAIFAERGLLRAETLRFGDEVRDPAASGIGVPAKIDPREVKKAARAIEKRKARSLEPDELDENGSAQLLALAKRKLARGENVVTLPEAAAVEPEGAAAGEESAGEVIDLFALIRDRLRDEPARARASKARRPA